MFLKHEDNDFVGINMWILAGVPIRLASTQWILRILFLAIYYYDKTDDSIYDEGASIMRDTSLYSPSIRAMIDNAAISAGPIIEANVDILAQVKTQKTFILSEYFREVVLVSKPNIRLCVLLICSLILLSICS